MLVFNALEAERFPVWEPGAGDGTIAAALTANEWNVLARDIAPRREGIARLEFLHDDRPIQYTAVISSRIHRFANLTGSSSAPSYCWNATGCTVQSY